MRKTLCLTLLVVGLVCLTLPTADAFCWWRRGRARYRPVVEQPVQQAQTQTDEGYRRFSYEPGETVTTAPTATYRSYQRAKEPWQYSKTDRRRYRVH